MTTYVDSSYRIAGFKTAADVNGFIAELHKAGHTGVIGYVSPYASKNIPAWVAKQLIAADFHVVLVWEIDTARAGAGRQAGVDDAAEAAKQASAIGYPKGCVIFAAADRNDYTVATAGAYFGGWRDKLRGLNYVDGLYGDGALVNARICSINWKVETWGTNNTNADIIQEVNHPTNPVTGTDVDDVLHTIPDWVKKPVTTTPPKPTTSTNNPTATKAGVQKAMADLVTASHTAPAGSDALAKIRNAHYILSKITDFSK